eukprot:CAMPEP_0182417846 /NCGR_PEP_ID=MMETSP1167-20130531/2285_1 /TAXON_ID=2988 /ORGANISM="Mallomonas Sp, Strain CCMP3275" /LENGTH=320 /DNA_ID=CAMNT_0024591653 /DNA_START=154 /DNA_END=1113 /DNA_ORIENTATION=-
MDISAEIDHLDRLCYATYHPEVLQPCDMNIFTTCISDKLVHLNPQQLAEAEVIAKNDSVRCKADFQCLNHMKLSQLKHHIHCDNSTGGTTLWGATWVNDDAHLLVQWIIHHLLIGFDKLIIFDNRSKDNLKPSIQPFIDEGLVEYSLDVGTGGMHNQIERYNEALKKLQKLDVKWFLMIDVDEFVAMSYGHCLPKFLKKFERNETVGGVALNWRWIPSKGRIWRHRNTDGSVKFVDIFDASGYETGVGSDLIKTVVKVNYTTYYETMHHAHYRPKSYAVSPTTGAIVTGPFQPRHDINDVSVLHFHTRTFEDYLFRVRRW